MSARTWVFEPEAFANGDCLIAAAKEAGHRVIDWQDDWWTNNEWPTITGRCFFHGSLGNADRIHRELPWQPGAYCDTQKFFCSAWYPTAERLLHEKWEIFPAAELVSQAEEVFDRIGDGQSLFVRPDSPLKPFSGRVVRRDKLTLKTLDHGFYYDDENIPVVVAPTQSIMREWRFVVVDRAVVTGSGYQADGRTTLVGSDSQAAWDIASQLARSIPAPELVYVLDLCETTKGIRLLELNSFSGADLYGCEGARIIQALDEKFPP
jgi:hypothetical protein